MRIAVVTLGLAALICTGLAAQAPVHQHTFVPAHKQKLSVDFGAKQALKRLAQRPVDCGKVTHRRHEALPSAAFVELPMYGRHSRGIVTAIASAPVAPCSVR